MEIKKYEIWLVNYKGTPKRVLVVDNIEDSKNNAKLIIPLTLKDNGRLIIFEQNNFKFQLANYYEPFNRKFFYKKVGEVVSKLVKDEIDKFIMSITASIK